MVSYGAASNLDDLLYRLRAPPVFRRANKAQINPGLYSALDEKWA
jgi:hypothetical protein